jgi:ABC-type Mn2+/Zn2+ transport system ATPase subunit
MEALGPIRITAGRIKFNEFELVIGDWAACPGLTSVVGPNGSGKSTFLRTILGINALTSGERSSDLSDDQLGYVPQNYRQALIPWESCEGNFSRFEGVDTTSALTALAELGFNSSDFGKRPSQLSGGQCQRIALVRELAINPKVLVLDEPFASLDKRSIGLVSERLAGFIAAGGIAIIASHQNLEPILQHKISCELAISRTSDRVAELEICTA